MSEQSMPQVEESSMSIDLLIELIDALAVLIAEENAQLRLGAPASLAGTLALKVKLGSALERHVRVVRAGGLLNSDTELGLRSHLALRSAALQDVMDENTTRLRAALVSTRRRVDAIMRALRDQDVRPGRYDKSGRRVAVSQRSAPYAGRTA
jgi:hypothetical protein